MEHTKTPWTVSRPYFYGDCDIYAEDDPKAKTICNVNTESDANYIVRCVNSHEKLVEAVETLLSITKSLTANYETCDLPDEIDEALEFAEEALALAEK